MNQRHDHPLRPAIEAGDPSALARALEARPEAANRPLPEGEQHRPHPIHAICDRVFDGRLTEEAGLALTGVLIDFGADVDARHPSNGDSLLIAAVSLGAPRIAERLLDAGADPLARGLFDASAIYWCAIMGMPDMVELLIPSPELARRDHEFASTPLGWAVEGHFSPPRGSKGEAAACARLLVEAGSEVEDVWRRSEKVRADLKLRTALGL